MVIKGIGFHRVSRFITDHLYSLKDLLIRTRDIAHATCIKLFPDEEMEFEQRVTGYLRFQEGLHCVVHEFSDLRKVEGDLQVLVSYVRFESDDPAWMSASLVREDVSDMSRIFCDTLDHDPLWQKAMVIFSPYI